MLRVLILVLVLFNLSVVFGQCVFTDTIITNKGTILEGVILEYKYNNSIIFQTKDSEIHNYNFNEIYKISKGNIAPEKSFYYRILYPRNKGFCKYLEIDNGLEHNNGSRDERLNRGIKELGNCYGFKFIYSYHINKSFTGGVGIGVNKYVDRTYYPVTMDVRYSILKSGLIMPMIIANIGYSFTNSLNERGLTFCPQLGIMKYLNPQVALMINVGYKVQQMKIKEQYLPGYIYAYAQTYNVYYQSININLGVKF